jgi:hypothetical protein
MTQFSFDPILRGMPLPAGVRRPSAARAGFAVNSQGVPCWRVNLLNPLGDPTVAGFGWTPEHALRAGLVGLLTDLEQLTGKSTAEARAFVAQRTTN